MTPLTRSLTVVPALGVVLIAATAALGGDSLVEFSGLQHWIFAIGLIVGECVPMRIVHDGSEGEITTSSTFAMAVLFTAGGPAALPRAPPPPPGGGGRPRQAPPRPPVQ